MYHSISRSFSLQRLFRKISPLTIFALIILSALLAFESFNFSSTQYALSDLLGNLSFAGIRWATILSVAFCGIDFAGIARLFTPQSGSDEPKEVWYLFGAWLLAATMNATLTWWGVSMAIVNHELQSTAIIADKTLTNVVPVFVALMVWVIRVLIIGTVTSAGERFLWGAENSTASHIQERSIAPAKTGYRPPMPQTSINRPGLIPRPSLSARPLNYQNEDDNEEIHGEPTYHRLGMTAKPHSTSNTTNQSRRM